MIDDIKKHFFHYLILFFILTVGGAGFLFSSDKILKLEVGILTSMGYIFWGIFHHLMENNLNLKIVIEYSLISLIAMMFLGGSLL